MNSATLQPISLLSQLRQQSIHSHELLPLLASYKLIPQLVSETIIDQTIANITCTAEETEQAIQQLYQQWHLESEDQQQAWRSYYELTQAQIEQMATRSLRIQKFAEQTWGHKLHSYFLSHKHRLDQVIYSLIRVKDRDLVNELYFRIAEGEQSFSELATQHSQGAERQTGGVLGPFEFGTLSPNLARLLYYAPIGEVQPPEGFGEFYAIVRVEQRIPAQLDAAMRQRLLEENFNNWLKEQLAQLPQQDQLWMGIAPQHNNEAA